VWWLHALEELERRLPHGLAKHSKLHCPERLKREAEPVRMEMRCGTRAIAGANEMKRKEMWALNNDGASLTCEKSCENKSLSVRKDDQRTAQKSLKDSRKSGHQDDYLLFQKDR
jgi:hypothetical protein